MRLVRRAVGSNLRFPGQYYDVETGKHYNYFRDYDAAIGRYIESDPIGLIGGSNTFLNVFANPLIYTDRLGLLSPPICPKGTDCPNPGYDPTPDGPKPSPQPSKPKVPEPIGKLKCNAIVKWVFGGCTCAETTGSYHSCMSCCMTWTGYLRSGGGTCQVGCLDKWPGLMSCPYFSWNAA